MTLDVQWIETDCDGVHVWRDAWDQFVDFSALAGDATLSTATVQVTLPSGFSRCFARATWT